MNKVLVFSLLLTLGFISCKNSEKEIYNLEVAKHYYKALDDSNDSEMVNLMADSIVIRENEYDYEETFSLNGYIEWLKWDSVFEPTYKILKMELDKENGIVIAQISKFDKRISFLHKEPIVTDEIIHFDNDKISRVEKIKYVIFNDSTFVQNRDDLLTWIDKNHPELNGFIHDQTETGGIKYLNAIELYKNSR